MNKPVYKKEFNILVRKFDILSKDVTELSERVKSISGVILRMTKKAPKKKKAS